MCIRDRVYESSGWERAVFDGTRPGRPRAFSNGESRELIAIACSEAPEGRSRWTIRLLMSEFKRRTGKQACFGTVRRTLAAENKKPWLEKNVVRPVD